MIGGALDERPGDGEPLALAAGEVRPALGDRRLEPALHRLHEVATLGDVEGAPELLVGRPLVTEAQVGGDGPAEQERLLGDEPDALPEHLAIERSDIDAIDEHGALGRVVQARDQVHDGGLAAAGASDDGRGLAGPRLERDGVQHRVLGAGIAEADIAELDQSGPLDDREGDRFGRIGDGRLRLEDLLDPAGGHGGPRHQDEHEHRGQDREQDLHQVLEEGGQAADRQGPGIDPHRPEPDHRDRREVEDRGHRRDRHREEAVHPEGTYRTGPGWRRRTALPRAGRARTRG